MSKEFTKQEVREKFLKHIGGLVKYWENQSTTSKDKLEGLSFSILAAIDGSAMALPSFILAPCPHPDDKKFHIDEESNYYAENHNSDIKCDIAGGLHELVHSYF